MTNANNNQLFSTSDLPLIVVLSQQFSFVDIDRNNANRTSFVFELTPSLQTVVNEYESGSLLVEPRKYHLQERYIKSLIYGGKT